MLETGVRQIAALKLCEGFGYMRIPANGEYVGAPVSHCMAKDLA